MQCDHKLGFAAKRRSAECWLPYTSNDGDVYYLLELSSFKISKCSLLYRKYILYVDANTAELCVNT